ncbi:MAG: histidinol-phosphate transaminase [Acidimicrobiia bacterium]|nr:histidinol-phosphate transaminase [Acidimicrobiia bacterium]
MVRFRDDLTGLRPYIPGRGEREILAAYRLEAVVKLASNECPTAPFPEVVAAISEAAASVNRYPETVYTELGSAVGELVGVSAAHLWFGGGGAELLREMTLAVAGPGTSVVYPNPSFVVYELATVISGATPIPVPLDENHRLDLDAMGAAVRHDTTLVFVCNPNNPTGTHVPTESVRRLLESVPSSVLVVVDEAYLHYVDASDYASMVPLVDQFENLVVLHTFSKVYGLAGLRIGYAVGQPELINQLRRVQLPFTANRLAQVAASEAIRHQDRVKELIAQNGAARTLLIDGLEARGVDVADSQTNFVYCRLVGNPADLAEALLQRGVIIRPTASDWMRVTVGTKEEIQRFLAAYDDATA